ncbi:hypothetical protein K1719_013134 [Acacia pycnantha]|nr:hypothetical protein K1719_013134 [Acacia pycnantha]
MERRQRDCVILLVGLCLITLTHHSANVSIPVGVILDSNSSLDDISRYCINISLQDFYSTHDSDTTNLTLHFRSSGNDILTAADVAQDLINNTEVRAILGPQNSEQARFVVELGAKYDVPVIWFSPSGPSLLPPRSRFFIPSNTTSLCLQFEAIAAIIQAYKWQCVIPIYEEPEFGNDLMPCVTYALQEMDTRVPNTSPIRQDFSDDDINKELDKIKDNQTCVFLAHMTVELWSRLVILAQKKRMMDKRYAWILTQGLSSVIDPGATHIKENGYMDGVLGVTSRSVDNITQSKRLSLAEKLRLEYGNKTSLSLYGLWAYDTITALAKAVENASLVNSDENRVDLREAIKDTYFLGLSGDFSLRQGQLESSRFVVYNVKEKRDIMIIRILTNDSAVVEWLGNAEERLPRLRIGVPRKTHFTEFVNVSGEGKSISPTGFAVDVFYKVIRVLPFNLSYGFVPMNNFYHPTDLSNYERLLCDNKDKVDVIIGDITIVENRTKCVDFTMPYLDSSVSMVVKVTSDSKNGWILLKPFDWKLWLILGVIFVGATVIVIILERKIKDDTETNFKHFVRNPFLIYMSDVFSLKRGTSKWVAIVVMFVLSIALQVYTSNLTPILSERTMGKASTWKDVQEIKRNNVKVGYQRDSWVRDLLINQIGLGEDQLKALNSLKEYKEELSKGAKKGGVDAIFDETPYLFLLLSECSSCKMTGPMYKAGGFAFAFPKNSAWVSSFSAAILNVTQNVMMFRDMKKKIHLPVTMDDKSEYNSTVEMRSLKNDDFGGLFPIVYSVLALFFVISMLKVK